MQNLPTFSRNLPDAYFSLAPCQLYCRAGRWSSNRGISAKDASRCYSDIRKKDICLAGKCVVSTSKLSNLHVFEPFFFSSVRGDEVPTSINLLPVESFRLVVVVELSVVMGGAWVGGW